MRHAGKHVQLRHIGSTELRVIAEVDAGAAAIVQEEEAVIRAYIGRGGWPHRQISLFILKNLESLARQVTGGALPPGGADALNTRPVINIFDLAALSACHIFVNRQAMAKEGYWDDRLAIRGLLAHEHAHPLAENASTRASRALQVEVVVEPGEGATTEQRARLTPILAQLLELLCLTAPREIFTNQVAIASGFVAAMLHLNEHNVTNACQSLAGRETLCTALQREVEQGARPADEVGQLLLAGDLASYLKLAMETAPFERAGHPEAARKLEQVLEQQLFPQLEPQVAPAYRALRQLYTSLPAGLAAAELQLWSQQAADIILAALRERGLVARGLVRVR